MATLDISDIESKIITQIKTVITDMEVIAMPSAEEEKPALDPDGQIIVQFNGSDSDEPIMNRKTKVDQFRTLNWLFVVKIKNLFKHNSIYTRIENLRDTLTGFTPAGYSDITKMWHVSDIISREDIGLWVANVIMAHQIETTE